VGFLRSDDEAIFAGLSLPQSAKGAVVICSSLYEDFLRNYRREVLLSRALAAGGLAAARFHYRGSGNSEGDSEGLSFDRMVADAMTVGRSLREASGDPSIAYLGTRLGGLVAAAASKADGAAPLALWEPTVQPRSYFREAFMASSIRDLKRDPEAKSPMQDIVDVLHSEGRIDLLGYTVTRSFHDDLIGRSLMDEIGPEARPVLLVQVASEDRLGGSYERLANGLRGQGCDVVVETVAAEQSWWFTGARWVAEEHREGTKTLIDRTASWFDGVGWPSA
jgi:hypothetical protein